MFHKLKILVSALVAFFTMSAVRAYANTAPVTKAGPDQNITALQTQMAGSITDDGLPNPPGMTTGLWSVAYKSPPTASVTFANPAQLDTSVSVSGPGFYVLMLTGSDSALTSAATMYLTVSVSSRTNQAPVVNAGPDQNITTLSTALAGTISDDGLPNPPGMTTANWTLVSSTPGSPTVTFADPTKLNTQVTFSGAGQYTLRLTGSDSALSASDTVVITVQPPQNKPPLVNAGPDQNITTLATTLAGTISDDGLPNPPGKTTAQWTLAFSTPGSPTVTFADPTKLNTLVTFSKSGLYTLRLTGSDGSLVASDTVNIIVQLPAANHAPAVYAGPDQQIKGFKTTLAGTVSDDGLPNPPGMTTAHWDLVSSTPPLSTAVFDDPTKLNTGVTFNKTGLYILRLTASDGALSASDDVQIIVSQANVSPVPVLQGEILTGTKNKFRPQAGEVAKVVLELPEDGPVQIVIDDAYGKFVKESTDSSARKGAWSFEWNGTDSSNRSMPSGVYRATISQNGHKLKIISFVIIR